MEGGELFDKVVSIDRYPESMAKLLFYQMACACKVGAIQVRIDRYVIRVDRCVVSTQVCSWHSSM